jgi:hypothetical protein
MLDETRSSRNLWGHFLPPQERAVKHLPFFPHDLISAASSALLKVAPLKRYCTHFRVSSRLSSNESDQQMASCDEFRTPTGHSEADEAPKSLPEAAACKPHLRFLGAEATDYGCTRHVSTAPAPQSPQQVHRTELGGRNVPKSDAYAAGKDFRRPVPVCKLPKREEQSVSSLPK